MTKQTGLVAELGRLIQTYDIDPSQMKLSMKAWKACIEPESAEEKNYVSLSTDTWNRVQNTRAMRGDGIIENEADPYLFRFSDLLSVIRERQGSSDKTYRCMLPIGEVDVVVSGAVMLKRDWVVGLSHLLRRRGIVLKATKERVFTIIPGDNKVPIMMTGRGALLFGGESTLMYTKRDLRRGS